CLVFYFFQAEDGIRDFHVTGVQTCALPISNGILTFFSVSDTTATMVTSEPVPDVVGITKNGFSGLGRLCAPEYFSRSSPPSETRILVALEVSMTEPPPTAMIASQ